MEWVRRNYLLTITSIAIAVFVGFQLVIEFNEPSTATNISSNKGNDVTPAILPLSCFETMTATIQVVSQELCPTGTLSLGNSALQQIVESDSKTSQAHPLLLSRFYAASMVAKIDGVNLYITSGFRSLSRQERLFANAVKKYGSESEAAKWVLPAPYSHHPQGLALDINYPGDPLGASWLERNGARFGLCRVYANEWWHFEAVIAPGENCPSLAPNALVDLR